MLDLRIIKPARFSIQGEQRKEKKMNTVKLYGEGLIKSFINSSIPYGFVWDEKIQGDYISVVSYGDWEIGGQNPLEIKIPGLKSWKEKGVYINPHKIYEEIVDFFIE